MKRFLLILSLLVFGTLNANAQCNGTFAAGTVCGNNSSSNSPPKAIPFYRLFTSVPYVDVKSGANGCAAAVGNGSNDDTAAIQCQATFLYDNYSGGILFFSPGNYKTTSALIIKGSTILQGSNRGISGITAASDINVLSFDATVSYGGIRDIFIVGSQSALATHNVIEIATNVPVMMRDCTVWGGFSAIYTAGVDGTIENCYLQSFAASGATIVSQGANWYIRVKIDSAQPVASAFIQGVSLGVGNAENHFVQCDFSGNYTNSVLINDSTSLTAITIFESSVFSSPIQIEQAKLTIFSTAELGSTTLLHNNGELIIGTSWAQAATTLTGTGGALRSCGVNRNITC